MDFLEDLFENLFDRRNRQNWKGGHKPSSGHHGRQTPSYEKSSMVCTECGVDNNVGNRYCSACGNDLTMVAQNIKGNVCGKCGARNQIGSKYCQACGSNLTYTTTICQACGFTVPSNAGFCPQCGQNVGGS